MEGESVVHHHLIHGAKAGRAIHHGLQRGLAAPLKPQAWSICAAPAVSVRVSTSECACSAQDRCRELM